MPRRVLTGERKPELIAMVSGATPPSRQLARLVRLAGGYRDVVELPSPEALGSCPDAAVVTCWSQDAADVVMYCDQLMPNARVIVWISSPSLETFELASMHPRIGCILAWPDNTPSPRTWELALALRRLAVGDPSPIAVERALEWEGVGKTWHPCSTHDLFASLDDLTALMEEAGIDQRTGRRLIGVAHEMIMNAMYDAPTEKGRPRFAHDRTQTIVLEPAEAPALVARTDGLSVSLSVTDPFGGLRREHVYKSIIRGLRASNGGASSADVVDTSGGGAGLGLHRIVCEANCTIFDVVDSLATNVTSTFDLGQPNRERRRHPKSLLFFARAPE